MVWWYVLRESVSLSFHRYSPSPSPSSLFHYKDSEDSVSLWPPPAQGHPPPPNTPRETDHPYIMPYEEVERLVRQEKLEEKYDVGAELGRLVAKHSHPQPLIFFQRQVCYSQTCYREGQWPAVCSQVPQETQRW